MSLLSYRSHISLTGGMKKLVRILDAAKKNLETDKVINHYIALPDLLDEESMQDCILQEKKRRFDELGFKKFILELKKEDNDGEECLEDSIEENYSNERMILIAGTGRTDKGFEIKFELLEEEDRPVYADWLDWSDIARVYGVTIIEDVELYENGVFVDCCGSYIYEPNNGHPNKE